MTKTILITVILVCAVSEMDSAKILAVFPMPCISHQVVFRRISQELANRGHDITVITPDPAYPKGEAPPNYKEIDVHDVSYGLWQKFVTNVFVVGNVMSFKDMRQGKFLLTKLFQTQFETKEVQELISNSEKFDVILIESLVRPALVYSYIFKAPVILVSSFGAVLNNNKLVGSPTHPLLYPTYLRNRFYNLSFIEKVTELYMNYLYEYADYLNEQDENEMLREYFGTQFPTLYELSNNVDMLLLNVHSIWADNQPVAPNVIYMGGIHQVAPKELPKKLKSYLDSSKHGVIYISFGTNVLASKIPEDKVHIIINVLSKLPYDVLWKWDKDELPKQANNIKISKWLPQSDLLSHKKIKLFITQAGLQSTDEAITAGVPLVAIPMIGDQWYNAEKYEKFGIGVKLDINTFTKNQFENAVTTVIKNDSYRHNIIKLSGIIRDQPETPLNRTMWWIEYILRHQGAKHLRSPVANMSYVEYFEIVIVLFVISLIVVVLILILLIVNLIIHFLSRLNNYYTKSRKKRKKQLIISVNLSISLFRSVS